MIFNDTNNYKFSTRLTMNNFLLDIIDETKLLGVILSADLTWRKNTKSLVKRGYSRIIILQKLFEFDVPEEDLVNIYCLFIRSILEQSCVVWHSAITQEEENDLERVQKVSLKIILKDNYIDYDTALKRTQLEDLKSRRERLCLKFAKSCLKYEETKDMFPTKKCTHEMKTRCPERFQVQPARTDRLAASAIPYLQRLLNSGCVRI